MEMPKYFYFRVKAVNKGCGFEVEDASDVDVAEIVRCQDCRYFDIAKNGVNGICKEHQRPFFAYDYCSLGDRKDEE